MIFINILAFQIGWFACVLGGAHHMSWLGPIVVMAVMAWHFKHARILRCELLLAAIITALGFVFDQTLLSLHFLAYPQSAWPTGLLPIWMVGLWLLFSSTLNTSLRWMRGRRMLSAAFGAIGGPMAYLGAAKLGAITVINQQGLLLSLAIGWAILMPTFMWLAALFDGYASKESALEVIG